MCIRDRRLGESLQEFEVNVNRLTRLAYPEKSEDFRTWIAHIGFIDCIRDSNLQVLRMARHQISSDALVPVSYTHLDVYKRQI